MSTIGFVCDNTCVGYSPGDDTPDYLGLFGPPFGQIGGQPFILDAGSLTINGHSVSLADYSISFTDPLLSSFAKGAFVFTAVGVNPYGIAIAETEYLCPVIPGVPEPATWLLMLIGFYMLSRLMRNVRTRMTPNG